MEKKTCADCKNVMIYTDSKGKKCQVCETVGWGMPMNCAPPYDEPCEFFSETEKFDNDIFDKIISDIKDMDWDDD